MTRGDKLLLTALLLTALLSAGLLYGRLPLLHSQAATLRAVIAVRGTIIRTIPLPTPGRTRFVVEGRVGPSTIEIDGTRLRVLDAHCTEQICVRQGWISRPGQSIICMPGEIMIRIEGTTAMDAVTR
jgi:hypothetical protein